MISAHLLWHIRLEDPYGADAKLIGVYSTAEAAQFAIGRVKNQPGFIDHANGFQVDEYEIDKDHWTEGFGA